MRMKKFFSLALCLLLAACGREEPVAETTGTEGPDAVTPPPAGLSLVSATDQSLTFRWTAASGVSTYSWSLTQGGSQKAWGNTGDLQVTIPNLPSSTTFTFSVKSLGATYSEAVTLEASTSAPPGPGDLAVTETNGTSLSFSWSPLTPPDTGFGWELQDASGAVAASGAQTENTLTVTGLATGVAYTLSVWVIRDEARSEPATLPAETLNLRYVMETTLGKMTIELYDDTPLHRDNFIKLADAGTFDGVKMDRIMSNLAQFGYSASSLGYTLLSEVKHKHRRGTVSSAEYAHDQTSPLSFYFSRTDTGCSYLDTYSGGFTVFGEIVDEEGLATLDQFFTLIPASGTVPTSSVSIISLRHP